MGFRGEEKRRISVGKERDKAEGNWSCDVLAERRRERKLGMVRESRAELEGNKSDGERRIQEKKKEAVERADKGQVEETGCMPPLYITKHKMSNWQH